jgi:small conductance mechanosensitive channel
MLGGVATGGAYRSLASRRDDDAIRPRPRRRIGRQAEVREATLRRTRQGGTGAHASLCQQAAIRGKARIAMPETIDKVGASLSSLKVTLAEMAIRYGLQILAALAILIIGLQIARWAGNVLDRWLGQKPLDVSLRHLVVRVFRILLMAATVTVAAEKAGVPVTSLIAGIGVAGVGAGFALQGVLGNVFAGLTILFTRPFRVGEYIEILGERGQVTEITVFTTTLLHADQSSVVIPNRKIVGEILHNYGTKRQMEVRIGVSYATDLEKALAVVQDRLLADPRVLQEPAPLVGIQELGDSAIVISVRPWVGVADYEVTRAALNRALVEAFRAQGIDMPFPQREVRLLGPSGPAAA